MKNILTVAVMAALAVPATVVFADGSEHGSGSNPSFNVILEGRYANYDHGFELPGFQLGGHSGAYEKGFSTGHNELNISSNVSKDLFGVLSASMESGHEGTSVEVEEAYLESKALGNGVTVKVGQFFSSMGNLNVKHEHRQDFADVPLVYLGMFNSHLVDTGVQVDWQKNMGLDLRLGLEVTSGAGFPGGQNDSNVEGLVAYAKLGGKVGTKGSWSAGLSSYSSSFAKREGGGHHGGGESLHIENGETEVTGLDLAYTMAPNGKGKNGEFTLQLEYFSREEHGHMEYEAGTDIATADYDGDQTGYYIQAVYSFLPNWRVGLRYDNVEADNTLGSFNGDVDAAGLVLTEEDTGLEAHEPSQRTTLMLDVNASTNSTVRLQFMNDESGHQAEERIYMQYLVVLGG